MIQYEILNGIIFQLLLFSISISLSPYNMRSLFIDACTIITSKDLPKVAIKSFWTYTKNIEVILSITKSIVSHSWLKWYFQLNWHHFQNSSFYISVPFHLLVHATWDSCVIIYRRLVLSYYIKTFVSWLQLSQEEMYDKKKKNEIYYLKLYTTQIYSIVFFDDDIFFIFLHKNFI